MKVFERFSGGFDDACQHVLGFVEGAGVCCSGWRVQSAMTSGLWAVARVVSGPCSRCVAGQLHVCVLPCCWTCCTEGGDWMQRRVGLQLCVSGCSTDRPSTGRTGSITLHRHDAERTPHMLWTGLLKSHCARSDMLRCSCSICRRKHMCTHTQRDAATYVHRVGRTGRFGTRGVAVSYVTRQELQLLQGYLQEVSGGGP